MQLGNLCQKFDLPTLWESSITFAKLKEIAGIVASKQRDVPYYSNPTFIREDLISFSQKKGLNGIHDLSRYSMSGNDVRTGKRVKIKCVSGDVVTGLKYLSGAAAAFKIMDGAEQECSDVDALARLKSIAGVVTRDEDYYRNSVYVRRDLLEFLSSVGLSDIFQLNATCLSRTEAVCSNGENVQGVSYLTGAGIALSFGQGYDDIVTKWGDILDELKVIAGFSQRKYGERDREYYLNPTLVREDLVSFAILAGRSSILELSVRCFKGREIAASNGEVVQGTHYLTQAGVCLGLSDNRVQAHSVLTEILKRLIDVAGGVNELDGTYFQNTKFVKADLDKVVKNAGLKGIHELDTKNKTQRVTFQCQYGFQLSWCSYIARAAVAFGFKDMRSESIGGFQTVTKLKEIAGYQPKDKNYFSNPSRVREDLMSFVINGKFKGIGALNAGNIASVQITMTNGDQFRGSGYLDSAANALGYSSEVVGKSKTRCIALDCLKSIVGYVPLDTSYFGNKQWVTEDLRRCAQAAGLSSIQELNTHNLRSVRFIAVNGDEIAAYIYLDYSALALEGGEFTKDVKNNRNRSLVNLRNHITS